MGKDTKTPDTPDYEGVADKQLELNARGWDQRNQANRPDQVTDTGTVKWSQDENGNWTQTSSLADPQKALLDSQTGAQTGLANAAHKMLWGLDKSQIDLGQAPGMPGVVDYGQLGDVPHTGQYNQQVIDSLRSLQDPTLQRAEDANRSRMAAMGMGTGTGRANQTQEEIMGQNRNDADLKAILAGVEQGNTEFDQNMLNYQQRQGQLENQFDQGTSIHQQGVSDILNERTGNIGQITGLMGLMQGQSSTPGTPDFNTAGEIDIPDYLDAETKRYIAELNRTNASNADSSNKYGVIGDALGGIGSMLGK